MAISSYDPFDPAVIADPYPYYAFLREQAPCYHAQGRDIYVLSRYEDVRAALADTDTFSSTEGVGYERRPVPMMIAYDPPEHSRLRRIVAGRFTPRALAAFTPRIEHIVESLLDPLLGAGTIDLCAQLAVPFPVQVIAELMDIPIERRADFKRWSDSTVEALSGAVHLSEQERMEVEMTIVQFAMYFAEVIKERTPRAAEADDLISLLLRPSEEGERLSEAEVVSFCVLLLVAGNETTTNLISNSAFHLLRDPAPFRALRENPARGSALIEECLRFEAPIQGFFRNTRKPARYADREIPAGAKVMLLYGSANRDPHKFPEPDQLRIDRNPTDHIAFGFGPHTCLGAHLARIEVKALLARVLQKVAKVELAGDPVRGENPLLRGFSSLPVRITAR